MTGYQIPRNSLALMLASQVAVIAPHVTRLPIWIIGVCLACFVWRVMIYQGRWSYPGRAVKALLVLGGFIGIPLGYQKIYGVEPAVALLIVAFVLKLLEMHHKRDAYVVILMAYFVSSTVFLFEQSIPYTFYMLATVILITAALVGLHQTLTYSKPLHTLRVAGTLVLQASPLMIVLFVLFPRLQPLWTVPLPTEVAKTGVSEFMQPGDVALLTQSDDLVFRATFEGQVPPISQLYWRGLVLTEFDGRTWTHNRALLERRMVWRDRQREPGWLENIEFEGNPVTYDIILEPTQQHWLFSLAVPHIPEDREIVMLSDYRLVTLQPVRREQRYKLTSYRDYTLDRELDDFWKYRFTRLPEGSNPRSKAWAEETLASAGSPAAYINEVRRYYSIENFVYTLKPPTLGRHSVDEFMFDTRRGFCEHYAGSFVFLMRAAGIPARVVVGYQGGELNPNGNYVSVRQFDAHAWAEVWLEGEGWVRVDPVQSVAPDRVEFGLEQAIAGEDTFLEGELSIFKFRQFLWLQELRLQFDAIGHYWDTWVVGYTPDTQMSVLTKYLGDVSMKKLGMMMLASFFSIFGIIGLVVLARRSTRVISPTDSEYLKFCRTLARRGYPRETGEGPQDYARRLAKELPAMKPAIDEVTDAYIQENYMEGGEGKLKQAVRAFRMKFILAS